MYDNKEYRRVVNAIADELEAVSGHSDRAIVHASLKSLAERLVKTYRGVNANFKESRFMEAAGFVWDSAAHEWRVSPQYGGYVSTVHVLNDNEPSHTVNRGSW